MRMNNCNQLGDTFSRKQSEIHIAMGSISTTKHFTVCYHSHALLSHVNLLIDVKVL